MFKRKEVGEIQAQKIGKEKAKTNIEKTSRESWRRELNFGKVPRKLRKVENEKRQDRRDNQSDYGQGKGWEQS